MFDALMVDTVVLRTVAESPGTSGTATKQRSAGTTFAGVSVQLADGVMATGQGRRSSTVAGRVYFTERPVDGSAGARAVTQARRLGPEVNAGDELTWLVDPDDRTQDRLLVAQGRATPEGGFDVAYSVAVVEST